MDLAEYEHMMEVYSYVYSAAPNTPEREKRLAEIDEKDNEKLWDFYSGLLSGRIKKPEATNIEREVNGMNEKKKQIKSYEDYKKALTRAGSYKVLCEFKQSNPELYKHYSEKWEAERAR